MSEASAKKVPPQSRRNIAASSAKIPRIYALIMESKGGVGKSVLAQATAAALSPNEEKVALGETDTTNSTMAMISGREATMLVDVSQAEAEGYFYARAEELAHGAADHALFDCGARDEKYLRPFLPDLARELCREGIHLVVLRPITLAHFVQANAYSFVTEVKTRDIGVVLVRNLSQGRRSSDFDEWNSKKTTAKMIECGAVVCDMENAGVSHSDNATSFGMSLVDVAKGDFHRAGADEELARQIINRPVQLFLARWLYRQTSALRAAIFASIGHSV